VKEALTFSFPLFENQKMFFNNTNDRMIVALEHNRVFIYQNMNPEKKEAEWRMIRQIDDYPFYLDNF